MKANDNVPFDRNTNRVIAFQHIQIPVFMYLILDVMGWLTLPLRISVWFLLSCVYYATVARFVSEEKCNRSAYKAIYVVTSIILFILVFFRNGINDYVGVVQLGEYELTSAASLHAIVVLNFMLLRESKYIGLFKE